MVDIDKSVVARLKKNGQTFEIFVDCEAALAFKSGKITSLDDVVATDKIYNDVKKSLVATHDSLQSVFGTIDVLRIAEEIIMHGEVQLTAEHLRQLRDQKKQQLVYLIHRNTVDAKTGLPHPLTRIENAFEEVHLKINEHTSAEEQLKFVVDQLRTVLPIRFELREVEFKIPAQYAGKAYGVIKHFAGIKHEDWLSNGSLLVVVEVSPGLQEDLENSLNSLTHGSLDMRIISKK